MSTDSTELTFVRCPSCRSLVPAMSTRCRMCGSQLDASSEQEEADEKDKQAPSRVRQRTMSNPKGELSSTVKKLREEMSEEEEPARNQEAAANEELSAKETAEELSQDDPLSAYIEEVEEEVVDDVSDDNENDDEDDDDLNDDDLNVKDDVEDKDEVEEAVSRKDTEKNTSSVNNGATSSRQTAKPSTAPRVIVESGNRRQGGGLSFGRKKEAEAPQRNVSRTKETPTERPAESRRAPEKATEAASTAAPTNKVDKGEVALKEEKSAERKTLSPERKPQAPSTKRMKVNEGMLFGWMVSYLKPEGEALELREGKFFVTASSLKKSDLVLDDPSVSTPHAMVTVSDEFGLQIQDLMSDQGFFVKRRGSGSFEQEEDVVDIAHGDRIRFGEVEFLVSLIAHVGEK